MAKKEETWSSYDQKTPEEIKEMLEMQIAAYLDYKQYRENLQELMEKTDESYEAYDPEAWMKACMGGDMTDKQMLKVMETLNEAEKAMQQIVYREKSQLIRLLKYVLRQSKEKQIFLLESNYEAGYAKELVQKVVDSELLDSSYEHYIEASSQHFLWVLKQEYQKLKDKED